LVTVSRSAEFRRLHQPGQPLLLPTAWDVASAALFARAGFAAVGTTSLGVAAGRGKLDGSAATRSETLVLAERLARLPCPVSVDIEGGFDDEPEAVADLARVLHGHGIAGVNIEDGRADGTLAQVDRQQEVIAAVKAAAPELFVNARTDTYWLAPRPPTSMDETIGRLSAYVAAGADGVFVPGVTEPGAIARLVAAVDRPVNALLSPTGPTLAQLADLGVARVSCGSLLFRIALTAAAGALDAIATGGRLPAGTLTYEQVQKLAETLTAGSGTRPAGGRP
jgi:2-methylisocitrate lyase-like PEP mutase family enzyme